MKTRPPGLLRRLAALGYDALLLLAILFAATGLLLPFNRGEALPPGDRLYAAYLVTVSYLFFGWCWTHGGQTLGMKAWHICLTDIGGGSVSWLQAAVRLVAGFVSIAAGGLGFWWMLFHPEACTWHDLISRTRVRWLE